MYLDLLCFFSWVNNVNTPSLPPPPKDRQRGGYGDRIHGNLTPLYVDLPPPYLVDLFMALFYPFRLALHASNYLPRILESLNSSLNASLCR